MATVSYVTTKTYTLTLNELEMFKLKHVLRMHSNTGGDLTGYALALKAQLDEAIEVKDPPGCLPT